MKKNFKKALSLFCSLVMLISALYTGIGAAALQGGQVYDYAFFDFDEVYAATADVTTATDADGRTFYPIRDITSSGASLSGETITVNDGGTVKEVTALKVVSGGYSHFVITDENGKPFQARENVTYTVRIKAYVETLGAYGQLFYGFGNYATDNADNSQNSNNSTKVIDSYNANTGTINTNPRWLAYPKFMTGSWYYNQNGGNVSEGDGLYSRHYTTFETSNALQYYDITRTYYVGLSDDDTNTETFKCHDASGNEYEYDNYFGCFISGGKSNVDGTAYKGTVYIDSIEIISNDTNVAKVSYYDGTSLIKDEYVEMGSTLIEAPQKEDYTFTGWYTDKNFNNAYSSSTVDSYGLKLYARYIYSGDDVMPGEGQIYDYVKYDFNPGEVKDFVANESTTTDSLGNVFYPVHDVTSSGTTLSQENITVTDGGTEKQVSALKVVSPGKSHFVITDKDGKPYEAEENKTYYLRVKAYVQTMGTYSQYFFGFGNYDLTQSDYTGADDTTIIDSYNANTGTINTNPRWLAYPKYMTGSWYYNTTGGNVSEGSGLYSRHYTAFDMSNSAQYYDITRTYSIRLNSSDSNTETFKCHDANGNEYEYDNYLGCFVSGGNITVDGVKHPTTVYIDSIEVWSEDTNVAKVTYMDGETVLGTEFVDMNSAIMDAPEKEGHLFVAWYTDPQFSQRYTSETVDSYALTLYARYADENSSVNIKYYNGDQLIKEVTTMVCSKLWTGNIDGYYFAGWYTDKEFTKPYGSVYAELEDLILYGKFIEYADTLTMSNWTSKPSELKAYYQVGEQIGYTFEAGGWNYKDGGVNGGNYEMKNPQTWVQAGSMLAYDLDTNEAFIAEELATYKISLTYAIPKVEHLAVTIALGYGMNTSVASNFTSQSFAVQQTVVNTSSAQTEYETVEYVVSVPQRKEGVLPCLGVYTNITGRSDETNTSPETIISISNITITKMSDNIVGYGGASILNQEASDSVNGQALRVFYNYTLSDNGTVDFCGEELTIVERGILMKAAENETTLCLENRGKAGIIGSTKIDDLSSCWSFDEDTNKLTYSMYVGDFEIGDLREVVYRSYVILSNGVVVYTSTTTNSIKALEDKNDINQALRPGEKEKITVMLIIGQSNAEGAGYSEEKGIVAASGGLWQLSALPTTAPYGAVYMSTSGAVTSLTPEFEYSTSYVDKKGGYAPAFAAEWYNLTGERVVILQLALGATSLAEWQKDANVRGNYKELSFTSYDGSTGDRSYKNGEYYLYKRAANAFNETYAALSEGYDINHAFYIWNQGENAEQRTNPETQTIYNDATYEQYFEKMHDDFMADCPGLEHGTIIAVRSCRATSNTQGKAISASSTNARRAQYRISARRDDVFMVSWLTESCNSYANFWKDGVSEITYGSDFDLVPSYKGCSYGYSNMHYTQIRYNEMGKDGAINYYNSLYGNNSKFDGVAVRNAEGTLIGKFDTDGSGSLSITNSGKIDTQFLQIRNEDASCTYDFALSVDIDTATVIIDVYTDGSHPESGDSYISEYGEINWTALAEKGITTLGISCNIH